MGDHLVTAIIWIAILYMAYRQLFGKSGHRSGVDARRWMQGKPPISDQEYGTSISPSAKDAPDADERQRRLRSELSTLWSRLERAKARGDHIVAGDTAGRIAQVESELRSLGA